MLTKFGITLRKFRLEHHMRLLDLAQKLGQSSAYLSAVETGRKPIPASYVADISRIMNLNAEEQRLLQSSADHALKEVRVDNLQGSQRELVAAFARRVDTMSPEELASFRESFFKSVSGDIPFKRKRVGLLVAPQSTKALRQFAEQIRNIFVAPEQMAFPVMDVIENKLEKFVPEYFFEVGSREEMGRDEGRVIPGRNSIILREDVYEDAWNLDGRARFTAAHELAHFLMHRQVAMARMRQPHHKIYCDAEWQADEFAGSLLMSRRHISSFVTADEAACRCGVSAEAARVMMGKYRKEVGM